MQLNEIDFSALDVHEIGAWPLVLRIAVIIIACVVSIFVVYFLILSGSLNNLESEKMQLETKRKEFKEKYNMAINLDGYQKQMQEMQATYANLLKELPATSDIPTLVDNVSKVAEANGIKFSAIKIGEPQSSGGFYMELPIAFTLTGTYHNIGKFVSQVLKLPRIVTLGDFSLRRAGDANIPNARAGLLQMSLEVKTYWLSSDNDKKSGDNKNAHPQTVVPSNIDAVQTVPNSGPSAVEKEQKDLKES